MTSSFAIAILRYQNLPLQSFAAGERFGFKLSRVKGALLIRTGPEKSPRFLNPIGANDPSSIIGDILQEGKATFIRIPEAAASIFEKDSRFRVEEDRDNADYIYSSRDLIDLSGRKYDGKRNLIKKFKSVHSYLYIDIDASHTGCMIEFAEYWCKLKDCEGTPGLSNERKALSEIINNFASLNLFAGAIKVDEQIRALAIGEKLNPETLAVHFLKADPSIVGLYQVIYNEFMRAHAGGFKYVNLEQDLGVAGLRKFKLSYQPAKLLKKYTISLT